ncbi:TolC family protein, partial [Candidatus Auribacterota bacterium]
MSRHLLPALVIVCTLSCGCALAEEGGPERVKSRPRLLLSEDNAQPYLLISGLSQCIDIALKNNRRRPASRFAVRIAEAQHRQALSAYWPQIDVKALYTRLRRDPNFIFPATTVDSINTAFITPFKDGPDLGNPIFTRVNAEVPENDVKLQDRDTWNAVLEFLYPLYTGGERQARVKQAKSGIDIAREESRRTDLEIIYDVKRMYYGSVLARRLLIIGEEALARLRATLQLT